MESISGICKYCSNIAKNLVFGVLKKCFFFFLKDDIAESDGDSCGHDEDGEVHDEEDDGDDEEDDDEDDEEEDVELLDDEDDDEEDEDEENDDDDNDEEEDDDDDDEEDEEEEEELEELDDDDDDDEEDEVADPVEVGGDFLLDVNNDRRNLNALFEAAGKIFLLTFHKLILVAIRQRLSDILADHRLCYLKYFCNSFLHN